MKNLISLSLVAFLLLGVNATVSSQDGKIGFYKPNDQRGVNVFESPRVDTLEFTGLKVRIGGNFAQQYQAVTHSNKADVAMATLPNGTTEVNLNALYPLSNGFNLASANLNFDIQLEDGIRVSLENYMSSRHHPEFWVKGGYIQIDKLPFFGNPEWYTRYVSARVGHFGINYGDQQFRRSDNGRTIYNPFVGNYIMDAFATEIGGEVYVYPTKDLFVMAGLTNGLIGGDVKDYGETKKGPSILAKIGYDSKLTEDLRVRLSASLYNNSGTTRNTLYAGDRAGSRYYMISEPEYFRSGGAVTASSAANRFTSGRLSPDFTGKVNSIMINPFVKFKGLEFFGTYEMSSGRTGAESENRDFTQLAGELIYRFLPREQAYVGGRYNVVSGKLPTYTEDVTIDRLQVALGWYTTKNLLVKLEYVTQNFEGFKSTDYRHQANFNGVMVEAVVAF
jgi:hypothetical protein